MKKEICTCDRCGKIITEYDYLKHHIPFFNERAEQSINLSDYGITPLHKCTMVDLCADCQGALHEICKSFMENDDPIVIHLEHLDEIF